MQLLSLDPSSPLHHHATVCTIMHFPPTHIACSLQSSAAADSHVNSHKYFASSLSIIEFSVSIHSDLVSANTTAYCLLSRPSCTYPADNPEPCERQQLTSTAVVIDHNITTTAIGVVASYVGQKKGAGEHPERARSLRCILGTTGFQRAPSFEASSP